MSATVIPFGMSSPKSVKILVARVGLSSRGPKYQARLGSADGDILIDGSTTPFFDSCRVLKRRGFTGPVEMWSHMGTFPRMRGNIECGAKLRVEESETVSPMVRPWRPFPSVRTGQKRQSRAPANLWYPKPKRPLASEVRAMRDFSKVGVSVWTSDKFGRLASDDARLLFFYALTSPHSNLIGCYRLHDNYAAVDLQWPVERYRKARAELIAVDLIRFDPKTMTVMIPKWWRFNAITSPSHKRMIQAEISRIPVPGFREIVVAEYSQQQSEQPKPNGDSKPNGSEIPSRLMTDRIARTGSLQ